MTRTISHSRPPSGWKKQLGLLGLVALALTVIFWNRTLDISFSELFFDARNPWPHADFLLWRVLYESDGYLTAILAAVAIVFIIMGARRIKSRPFVRYGIFIILSASLGAGLIVNGILKQHWGRPRPDEIVEFGGNREYARPWLKQPRGNGESFPSGHASIAFSYFALWFVFRTRRPRLAAPCLWGTIVIGTLVGLGRIVQGRHFLSDVLWAAFIPYLICVVLSYFVLHQSLTGGD